MLLGRDFNLNKTFSLDTYASIGYAYGIIKEVNNQTKAPEQPYVTSNGLFDTDYSSNGSEFSYGELHFRICLKLNVMF